MADIGEKDVIDTGDVEFVISQESIKEGQLVLDNASKEEHQKYFAWFMNGECCNTLSD